MSKTKQKQCSKCSHVKPASDFNKGSYTKDGLQYYCRDCARKYRRALRKSKRKIDPSMKVCEKCQEEKLRDQYYLSRLTEDGLFGLCKACCKTHTVDPENKFMHHYSRYMAVDVPLRYRGRSSY